MAESSHYKLLYYFCFLPTQSFETLKPRPDNAAFFKINPAPFKWTDFGTTGDELELQTDRQRNDVAFQPLRRQVRQLAAAPHQLIIYDEPDFLARWAHQAMTARIRAVQTQSPHFSQVKHLEQYAESAVHLDQPLVRHYSHHESA